MQHYDTPPLEHNTVTQHALGHNVSAWVSTFPVFLYSRPPPRPSKSKGACNTSYLISISVDFNTVWGVPSSYG